MDLDEGLSEYELMREQNIKELEAFMSEINSSDITDAIEGINSYKSQPLKVEKKKRKRQNEDETFRFTGAIPLEMRRSARLSNITPQYTYLDLPDDDMRTPVEDDDINNLEAVVFRKKRTFVKRPLGTFEIVPVEAITPQYLDNIAKRNTVKVYSQNGTSCHQCRQKTIDSKTYCRSGRCIGVRGQFCGVCLKNRYGEEARDALLDPQWECPPCRGLCNCSICRAREGKRPTGILAPIAFRHGHKSVKDFLISLNGKGDFVNESVSPTSKCTSCVNKVGCKHVELLGFNKDLCPVSVVTYENGLCEKECSLIGFDKTLKPVVIG